MALPRLVGETSSATARWRPRAALVVVLALASLLRVAQLGRQGLWSDECLTANWASLPWGQVGRAAEDDNNGPLFFYVEKPVMAIFGASEAAVRLVSAASGIATVGLIYLVGSAVLSARAGLLAAFLLTISPMHLHYSREGRSYALLGLLCLLALALVEKMRARPSTASVLGLAAVLAATLYTHPTGGLYLAGILAAAALVPPASPRSLRALGAAAALAAVAYLPLLPSVLAQTARLSSSFRWADDAWQREFPWQVARSLAALTHGSLAPVRNSVWDIVPSAWIGLGLVALLVVAGLRNGTTASRGLLLRLASAVVLPLVALFLFSWARSPVYVVGRVEAPLVPLFALLAAAAAESLPHRIARWLPAAFAGLAILPLEVLVRLDTKSQERSIVRLAGAVTGPRDVLVEAAFRPCLLHYGRFRQDVDLLTFPPEPRGTPNWVYASRHTRATLLAEASEFAESARSRLRAGGGRCIWVLCQNDETGAALTAALSSRLREVERRDLGFLGTELRRYVLPPTVP